MIQDDSRQIRGYQRHTLSVLERSPKMLWYINGFFCMPNSFISFSKGLRFFELRSANIPGFAIVVTVAPGSLPTWW